LDILARIRTSLFRRFAPRGSIRSARSGAIDSTVGSSRRVAHRDLAAASAHEHYAVVVQWLADDFCQGRQSKITEAALLCR
jgi:hypothetical protein